MCTNTFTDEKVSEESEQSEPDYEHTLEEMTWKDNRAFQETNIYQQYYRGLYDR